MRRVALSLIIATSLLAACSNSDGSNGQTATTAADTTVGATTTISVAPDTTTADTAAPPDPSRPYDVFTPSGYDAATPTPLVILLHGYGASGVIQEGYFGVQALAEEKGFLYVHPDGTKNVAGDQFWNATDACCGFRSDVDDVAYLTGIIDAVAQQWNVDPKRVFLMGHSNGGFMSYRMACDVSDRIAAIASLAGATFDDPTACTPKEPVSVLQVHGTADGTIGYEGGTIPIVNRTYPGAATTVATWAGYNDCAATPTDTGDSFDFAPDLPGNETTSQRFDGCPDGIDVELWSIAGGSHIPGITFADGSRPMTAAMVDFLLAHPKP
ncbi:MAG: alpha/beta hydrolase family esterase [Ilumatobacteraceae bacterium]